MNKLKFFLVVTSTLFVFLGSVGFNVFTHLCEKDGLSVSYFVQIPEHCEEHEHVDNDSCCDEEGVHDCCKDEVHRVNLKLDYVNEITCAPVQKNNASSHSNCNVQFLIADLESGLNLIKPPPHRSVRVVILQKQSWLI